ncbi:VanZ family protein [Natribacillus halophilus]|nr:VanZ family protein [Natribacillus halophilus]
MKFFAWSLFGLYMAGLLYITTLAWNYGASLGPDGPGGRNYNLIPFRSIYRIGVFSPTFWDPLKMLIGNVILFVPLGVYLPMLFRSLRTIVKVTLAGAALSLLIELYQFTFTLRVADIDDLLLNVGGVSIGAVIYFFFKNRVVIDPPPAFSPWRHSDSTSGNSRRR